MNAIPAQEIKRSGMSAVDEPLRSGPVHSVKNNRPQYVVLTAEGYQELLLDQPGDQASAARDSLRASLEDPRTGRVTRYDDVGMCTERLELADVE